MPPEPSLFFVPDLNILICDQGHYRFDPQALRGFLQPLLRHLEELENYRQEYLQMFICLSSDLKRAILEEFPWNLNDEEMDNGWIDIYNAIFPALNTAREKNRLVERAQIITPDMTRDLYFAHPTTIRAWNALVKSSEDCWSGEGKAEYIKILSDQETFLCVRDGRNDIYLAEVFPPHEWETVFAWARKCLPRIGDMPYIPHNSWHQGQQFPRGGEDNNRGWRDDNNRVWTWDYLHGGTHWHLVVYRRQQWQREYEVTPDGRIHHQY